MSNALVTVTFKDGLKLYSQYHGSSDTFYHALFETSTEAWSHSRHEPSGWKYLCHHETMKNPEVVEVDNDYGGGSKAYEARACRLTKQLRVWHSWLNDGWAADYTLEEFIKDSESERQPNGQGG